jgi:hypothetical protein
MSGSDALQICHYTTSSVAIVAAAIDHRAGSLRLCVALID